MPPLEAPARQLLFAADVVLANSAHEPFGLVGLEAMAAGGIVRTGCTREDYAAPGRNALVVQSDDPREFVRLFQHSQRSPELRRKLRRAARRTAPEYAWPAILELALLPHTSAFETDIVESKRTAPAGSTSGSTRARSLSQRHHSSAGASACSPA